VLAGAAQDGVARRVGEAVQLGDEARDDRAGEIVQAPAVPGPFGEEAVERGGECRRAGAGGGSQGRAAVVLDVVGEPAHYVGGEHPGLVGQAQHLIRLGHAQGGRVVVGVRGDVPWRHRGERLGDAGDDRGGGVEGRGVEAGARRVDEYQRWGGSGSGWPVLQRLGRLRHGVGGDETDVRAGQRPVEEATCLDQEVVVGGLSQAAVRTRDERRAGQDAAGVLDQVGERLPHRRVEAGAFPDGDDEEPRCVFHRGTGFSQWISTPITQRPAPSSAYAADQRESGLHGCRILVVRGGAHPCARARRRVARGRGAAERAGRTAGVVPTLEVWLGPTTRSPRCSRSTRT
jgi:hypothetical protein